MLLHDVCDPFLELAKICNYLNIKKPATISFLAFTSIFLASRIIVYPLGIIVPIFLNYRFFRIDASTYLFPFGLIALFFINLIWMFYIFKMLLQIIIKKEVEDDVRSVSHGVSKK